jgi:hypothetical protein
MEGNGLGLDFALLDVNLVAGQNDGNIFADTDEITCVLVISYCVFTLVVVGYIRCQLGTFL